MYSYEKEQYLYNSSERAAPRSGEPALVLRRPGT
jgi:hypothetical protein